MNSKLTGGGDEDEEDVQTATFEHRHENKSCSACRKDQHKH